MSAAVAQPLHDAESMQARQPCAKCAKVHDPSKCQGHSKRTGKPCGNVLGFRTDHVGYGNCFLHGGGSPNGREHARRALENAQLAVVLSAPECVQRLRRIVNDDNAAARDQILAARDLLDRTPSMGRNSRFEHSGPDGGPIPIEVRQANLLARARALRAGEVIDTALADEE